MASKRSVPNPGAEAAVETARTYRLRSGEFVPDGIRRIARGQLDSAHDQLEGASKRGRGEAIHKARKHFKRTRAALRLSRDALGEETYDRENATCRMAGRRLSAGRDAAVLVDTLDGLRARFVDELPPESTDRLREQLAAEHDRVLARMGKDGDDVGAALTAIDDARVRTPAWTFAAADDIDALTPGLRRIYRRGRKRMRRAASDPTTENLHEARKRVKDLWHAAQILRPAAPKRMKQLASDAHGVADLLGDDHDLAVLREYVERHPQLFAGDDRRQALLALIDRRRTALQHKALKPGARLYRRSPKRFVADIERGWRKRAGDAPQPVAG